MQLGITLRIFFVMGFSFARKTNNEESKDFNMSLTMECNISEKNTIESRPFTRYNYNTRNKEYKILVYCVFGYRTSPDKDC